MATQDLLRHLFDYHGWANDELLTALARVDRAAHTDIYDTALRLMDHVDVVEQLFAAHLSGQAPPCTTTQTTKLPSLHELQQRSRASAAWYRHYVDVATPQALAQRIAFVFTDGDRGCMSREEMLLHVLTHSGYHRGEAQRLLMRTGVDRPWDTFAVFLHRSEPARRVERETSPA